MLTRQSEKKLTKLNLHKIEMRRKLLISLFSTRGIISYCAVPDF